MRTPAFWGHDGVVPRLLAPAACLYGLAVAARPVSTPVRAAVPVLCVGNLTAGGAGKTPVAIALAHALHGLGARPHILTRGYGGRTRGPLRVDRERHDAATVGDEPLLLAEAAPTWVARDRPAGAAAATAAGAGCLVMDDGHQNRSLAKDVSVVVVDGGYGFGNGRLLPAGPLREPVEKGLARADAAIWLADPDGRNVFEPPATAQPAWHRAALVAAPEAAALRGEAVYAFAGIGRPAKFFATLAALGARVVGTRAFADHHPFAPDEVMRLVDAAQQKHARLVTTAKDFVRLPPAARALVEVVRVGVRFDDPDAPRRIVAALLART